MNAKRSTKASGSKGGKHTDGGSRRSKTKGGRAEAGGKKVEERFEPMDPVEVNHAMLVIMHEVEAERKLRSFEVEKLTGIKRQHQRKLRPTPVPDQAETHTSLVTIVKWCNGFQRPLDKVAEDLVNWLKRAHACAGG